MAQSKAMGLGAMLVFLVVAIAVLPMVVRFIDRMEPHYVISAFEDLNVQSVPSIPNGESMRDSPFMPATQGGDQCPEGSFYDGAQCVKTYVGGPVPDTGYFA
jgi:hypothetical protein